MATTIRHLQNYTVLGCLFAAAWIFAPIQEEFLTHAIPALGTSGPMLAAFFEMLVIFVFGFLVYEVSKSTVIPSFVVCIFIGMIERGSLQPIVGNSNMLTILTTFGAALILFGGGLDTPFGRFAKLIDPILAIATIGTIITALLFSQFLVTISTMSGAALPIAAAVILGAALASTDPAAIIPSLK
ncbi:MAG: monovalent cation:H+ antiporter, CPA1 family, partial [Candidatus Peregrinibacteria bacterium Greene0416_62]